MKKLLTLIASILITLNLFAQAPQKMSYQAVIRNASNNLVTNAPVKMRISILQGSATGTSVYSELHSATTNTNGLVSIEIGAGTSPTGTFSSINWGNGTYFLRTETDPNNGSTYSIIGTSQLLSVPYALQSNSSGNGFKGVSKTGDTLYLENGKSIIVPGISSSNNSTGSGSLATLTTLPIINITNSSAISGGNITSDGGTPVILKGVVWSTSPNPTVSLATKTSDGIGVGEFTSNIPGLEPNTTYYVRAYAINSTGSSYGNELSFKTTTTPPSPNNMTDIDGNSYSAVLICDKVWAAKNLDVSKYTDGTIIPQVTDPSQWQKLTTGAWCYYANNTSNGTIYGKLYNWYAIAGIHDAASLSNPLLRKKLAPQGWHIASETEWQSLVVCLGGNEVAGDKLKSTGNQYWISQNQGATNSSGFSALPGGYRDPNGVYAFEASDGRWWGLTEANIYDAWNQALFSNSGSTQGGYINKQFGFSVRCVKD